MRQSPSVWPVFLEIRILRLFSHLAFGLLELSCLPMNQPTSLFIEGRVLAPPKVACFPHISPRDPPPINKLGVDQYGVNIRGTPWFSFRSWKHPGLLFEFEFHVWDPNQLLHTR